MKTGRPSWRVRVPAAVLRNVDAALAAGEAATGVWRRFNLQQYGVTLSTFRKWATVKRADLAARRKATGETPVPQPVPLDDASPVERIIARGLESLEIALERNDIKVYELSAALRTLIEFGHLDIQRAAEARAQELHELKLNDLRKAVETASDGGTKELSAQAVYDVIDRVMRGEAA